MADEILYFTEDVDEFAIKVLGEYKDKEFKSVSSSDIDIDENDEIEDIHVQYPDDFSRQMVHYGKKYSLLPVSG